MDRRNADNPAESLLVPQFPARKRSVRSASQKFSERIPVVGLPAISKVLPFALGKACMVKDNFYFGALILQLELRNGIDAWVPIDNPPRLHDPLVGHQFNLPSDDVSTKE